MKIKVGSKNEIKVGAVRDAFSEYKEFDGVEIVSVEADSEVSNQPKTLEETIRGAINRAKNAFGNCDYSVGLESGIFPVPNTKSGYMDVCMCAIYDGKEYHIGASPMFEYPKKLIDLIFKNNYEVDDAAREMGITDNPRVGRAEGVIGILTGGVINRKMYSKIAVITALLHLRNSEHYS
ncbi:MAG: hypothetical protein A3H01_00930 [Candidatus Wildermuthbacteria bacterium RIFCSPLOWO2_12_FULL_40_9]|uniref:Probable inosine/xanthosine triphosphatase n=2 Tax=Candidatus Wildermuthiibacteriota TaxID=1817923 RepID=A0A1G2RDL4_9BACT|nr:MAG: hypothetical protein A3F15_02150 [Candidatus Wildermuthbacteria bacterium RIFCSPHIGHO2_12_FULL_40_12]OHA76824.1 MAG: hypothetical protein A3H01_00930 [Candidatus Wildermuthbacteria bacterium RIFCSPLOWO2_12_FULL_40_9]